MPAETLSIKANNHRIYQSPEEKKPALLNELIAQNSTAHIIVVTAKNAQDIKEKLENKDIVVMEDRDLVADKELQCEVLISYDIPIKAIVYMARVSKASQKALLLLDQSEQKELHAIEILLGRAIKQEVLSGYEYPIILKDKPAFNAPKKMSKEEIKGEAKKRYEANTQDAPKKEFKEKREFKDKKDFKPRNDEKPSDNKWAKKKKEPNKFLGKDENGKALFSGKDGARNHSYDGRPKEKLEAPKAGGRKISIKAMKPKEPKE